ncbi:hypothetical protein B5C34_12255 [Pacificimonas flava]|uniref:Peptidase M28 domain-containing protein n=2 Tax=Pacificimonas TaxID=1960290 RepID=A0A219B707_9SPHN|nr:MULTISPECIES: M28 family peptidase [Pacificimonas]MBZ6378562.1 M28 family peptidase [Pacificimonas aurantium]OWV34155.1 hypothetical protein B5C34_12255 [Pacificimonas flava]
MNSIVFLGAAALMLATACSAESAARDPAPRAASGHVLGVPVDLPADRLSRHVAYLSHDGLGGREPGTPGDEAARAYIADEFSHAGLTELYETGWQQAFKSETGDGPVRTANVAGLVPGRELPDEYIVILAHHDGQGLCAPKAREDRICNGAVDNASGVALLIELARYFAKDPAPRSLIFLATGAEESGLTGARHFGKSPPVPLPQIVAAFGLDTVAARGRAPAVAVLGEGLTNLDALVVESAARQGRTVDTPAEAAGFYRRSDHFAFAEAGIPALIVTGVLSPGEDTFLKGDYGRNRYHQPKDEADGTIDYSGAQADGALLADLIRALGPSAPRPAWTEKAPYGRDMSK